MKILLYHSYNNLTNDNTYSVEYYWSDGSSSYWSNDNRLNPHIICHYEGSDRKLKYKFYRLYAKNINNISQINCKNDEEFTRILKLKGFI